MFPDAAEAGPSKLCQWLFARLHPNFGIGLAKIWSAKSRAVTEEKYFHGDKEWLILHSKKILEKEHFDYFIYGHRHLPVDYCLPPASYKRESVFPPSAETGKVAPSRYINLGEWMHYFSYAVFDGEELELKYYKELLSPIS